MVDKNLIIDLIKKGISDAQVEVVSNDGVHFFATIYSSEFLGKSLLEQHRLVFDAIGDKMKQDIHALSIKTVPVHA